MAVERPDITKAELFKNNRRLLGRPDEVHRADFGALDRFFRRAAKRNPLEHPLSSAANEVGKWYGAQYGEIRGDRPDVGRDRHLVVVENDDEPALEGPGIIERFVGKASGKRAIADHRNDSLVAAPEIARQRHSKRGRNTRACM